MPDRQNPYLFPPVIAPPRTPSDVLAAGSAGFGHSVGTFSGLSRPAKPFRWPVRTFGPDDAEQAFSHAESRLHGRDYGLFDATNSCYVLSGDTQRPPLLFSLVFGEPEMDDCVFDDDISRPDLEPLLSLEPFLSHQFRQQFVADGSIVATDVGHGVVPSRRQSPYEVRPADNADDF